MLALPKSTVTAPSTAVSTPTVGVWKTPSIKDVLSDLLQGFVGFSGTVSVKLLAQLRASKSHGS